ncbi:MAG: DUF262 domain-containing protein, partial [Steroidobacteraceae bacterium]
MELQYEDSKDVLVQIAEGTSTTTGAPLTLSMKNIRAAYQVARRFLNRSFGQDPRATRWFYGYLTNRVKLIRIQAEDVAKALKIFETINDRGVGLDAMDLLKNLLFMKAERDEFAKLKDVWKAIQDTLFGIGEKPLRFLRYYILSHYEADVLREDEIYAWFSDHESDIGFADAPLAFAHDLLESAKVYRHFFEGLDRNGAKSRYLENMKLLGGRAARQHLILLLAGRRLASAMFESLCREVENLFFCYVITREATRDFERNFALWAREIRMCKTQTDLDTVFRARFDEAKGELAVRFRNALEGLHADALQGYRLKYVLAKLAQHVELAAYGETEGTRWLSRFVDAGFEIEHIFPQNPSPEAREEFGLYSDPTVTGRLGNLALVEKPINAALGNRPFSQKRLVYPQSQLLLTHSIGAKPQVGRNTRIDKAVAKLDPYSTWHETAIHKRQAQL